MAETATEAPPSAAGIPQSIVAQLPPGADRPQTGPGAPTDQPTWIVEAKSLPALAKALRDDPATRFDLLLDVCGVDFPDRTDEEGGRFEAVYHL